MTSVAEESHDNELASRSLACTQVPHSCRGVGLVGTGFSQQFHLELPILKKLDSLLEG